VYRTESHLCSRQTPIEILKRRTSSPNARPGSPNATPGSPNADPMPSNAAHHRQTPTPCRQTPTPCRQTPRIIAKRRLLPQTDPPTPPVVGGGVRVQSLPAFGDDAWRLAPFPGVWCRLMATGIGRRRLAPSRRRLAIGARRWTSFRGVWRNRPAFDVFRCGGVVVDLVRCF